MKLNGQVIKGKSVRYDEIWSKHCPVLLICSKMKYPPTQRSQRVSYYTDTCSCSSSIVMDTESASKYLKGWSLSDVIMLTIELASKNLERWTMTVWDWNRCPNLAIDVNTHMYCSRGRCYLSTLETTREENFSCFLFVFPHRTQWLVCQPTQILKMALYMSWTQSKMPGNSNQPQSAIS